MTALMLACFRNHLETAECLLAFNADSAICCKFGSKTALQYAIEAASGAHERQQDFKSLFQRAWKPRFETSHQVTGTDAAKSPKLADFAADACAGKLDWSFVAEALEASPEEVFF